MAGEPSSKTEEKTVKTIIITAAVTALVTGLIANWIPSLLSITYDWVRQDSILIVQIYDDDGSPVNGVKMSVSQSVSDLLLDSGTTDQNGRVKLRKVTKGMLALEGELQEGPYFRQYRMIHAIQSFPHLITLNRNKDFSRSIAKASLGTDGPITVIPTPSPISTQNPGASPSPQATPVQTPTPRPQDAYRIKYGKEPLTTDRRIKARLEIDWLDGTQVPELKAQTSIGTIGLEDLLKEVGIELEVVHSDKLPANVLGPNRSLSDEEAHSIAKSYRNAMQADKWHFYLIVVPTVDDQMVSFLSDTETRSGAAVSTNFPIPDTRFFFFSVVHEIGHMLNLPHPFQAYGDTKSVMSYFWRWKDWSWDDPQIYRFDQFGQGHIRRAPDEYVMPGQSAFLNYGAPVKWVQSG